MVKLLVVFIAQTAAAVLVRYDEEDHWFPKSQVECPELACGLEEGDEIELLASRWILKQKGLDDETDD